MCNIVWKQAAIATAALSTIAETGLQQRVSNRDISAEGNLLRFGPLDDCLPRLPSNSSDEICAAINIVGYSLL